MKIAVLGLGPSLSLFSSKFECTIGVNDIWSFHKTDVLVCLDHRHALGEQRSIVIDQSKPKAFYSQIVNWNHRHDFVKINFMHQYPSAVINLDVADYYKSYCSPFVACQVAYKNYNATEIHMFGVDMVNHPHLKNELCEKIKVHFSSLATALRGKGCEIVVHGQGILKDI